MALRKFVKSKTEITSRSESFTSYLREVAKYPLLSLDEEIELAYRSRVEKDEDARNKLVRCNLRFVITVAKQVAARQLKSSTVFSLEDIVEAGNEGLIKAAQEFDETKGFKFISYAIWWIRQSIFDFLAKNNNFCKVPLNVNTLRSTAARKAQELEQRLGRTAELFEIADELDVDESKLIIPLKGFSMDDTGFDSEINYHDIIPDDEEVEDKMLVSITSKEEFAKALFRDFGITERSKDARLRNIDILLRYYGLGEYKVPQTREEIGSFYDLSVERVRQIVDRMVLELRTKIGAGRKLEISDLVNL